MFLACLLLLPSTYTARPDPTYADPDADGLSNVEETQCLTNPFSSDTDGDGWDDLSECFYGGPFDTIRSWATPDDDGDWLNDYGNISSEYACATDLRDPDTDGDGVDDHHECWISTSPFADAPDPYQSTTNTDGDGVGDFGEALLGTDPGRSDTDGNGVSDYDQACVPLMAVDADGDWLEDAIEVWYGCSTSLVDTDGDGCRDSYEMVYCTEPRFSRC